ncbi:MAG: hypothetical protein ACP5HG_12750 [Anaerolineae bacterium]
MARTRIPSLLVLNVVLALVVAGCGLLPQAAETPEPTTVVSPTDTPVPVEPTASPTEEVVEPTPTEEPLATPEEDMSYQQVEVAEAGLVVEVPETWERAGLEWAWIRDAEGETRIGIGWSTIEPPQEPEAALLPVNAQTLESEPVELTLGSGREFVMEVYGEPAEESAEQAPVAAVQTHILVTVEQTGTRIGYDFYASAPTREALAEIEPALYHMAESATRQTFAEDVATDLRASVAEELNVTPEQVQLMSLESAEWPDACLGLPAEGEMCAQVITPGYRAIATVGNELFIVRSDEEIGRVEVVPGAVSRAREILAAHLEVSEDDIQLVSFSSVEWPDACLGIQRGGQMCAQVITPGYRVIFEVSGQQYELHTNEDGSSVGIAQGG